MYRGVDVSPLRGSGEDTQQPSSAMRTNPWFVVVTRNDPAWGENLSSEREAYALVVVFADR